MLEIQASISGFEGKPCTVYFTYDEDHDILGVAKSRDFLPTRVPGCVLVTNSATLPDYDAFFDDREDLRDAISAYFRFADGVGKDGRSKRLQYSKVAENSNLHNAIQVEGMDEHGPKYGINGRLRNEQAAILAVCLFLEHQSAQVDAVRMMNELNAYQYARDDVFAQFMTTI